jgi:hypothetical protein
MHFTNNIISKLYHADAEKANQLTKALTKGTPKAARNALKANNNLTKQLLFVTNGTIGVLTYPTLTTDEANNLRIIGSYGNDIDALAPAAITGELLSHSISALIPKAVANKYDLPRLAADPLELDAPLPSQEGPGPARLHVMFNEAENAPVIAVIPATFSVPLGLTPPTSWKLNAGEISEAEFPCESGRAWITAVAHSDAYHQGKPVHTDIATFNLGDLDTEPFQDYDMVDTIRASVTMLEPTNPQHGYVLSIAREEIQARKQLQAANNNTTNNNTTPETEIHQEDNQRDALQRQANVITAVIKSTLEATGNKDRESRSDRESKTAINDAIARYKLMYARIEESNDPDDTNKKIQTVKLPDISPVFLEILDITKLSDAVRMTQEQFAHHLAQRATSRLHQDTTIDFNAHSLDATTVAALKRADWNDRPLSIDPTSAKNKLGMYTLAPQRTDSVLWQQKVEAGQLIFRQENVGEDKSRISAKAHDLDHAGRMETASDLHSTIANKWAIASFITKEAEQSELWKRVVQLQSMWLQTDGKVWLEKNKQTNYLICCLILEVQSVLALYVRISNSLEYRQAVKSGKPIDPRAYVEANLKAQHVVANANNMIFRMNISSFIIQPTETRLFITDTKTTTEKHSEKKLATRTRGDVVNNNPGRNADGRNTERRNTEGRNTPQTLSQEQIDLLKTKGLLKFTGTGRLPQPADLFEQNGTSGLTKICMNFLCQERFCRYARRCNLKHITSLREFTAENKTKFQTFVTNHIQYEMATPGTPSSN